MSQAVVVGDRASFQYKGGTCEGELIKVVDRRARVKFWKDGAAVHVWVDKTDLVIHLAVDEAGPLQIAGSAAASASPATAIAAVASAAPPLPSMPTVRKSPRSAPSIQRSPRANESGSKLGTGRSPRASYRSKGKAGETVQIDSEAPRVSARLSSGRRKSSRVGLMAWDNQQGSNGASKEQGRRPRGMALRTAGGMPPEPRSQASSSCRTTTADTADPIKLTDSARHHPMASSSQKALAAPDELSPDGPRTSSHPGYQMVEAPPSTRRMNRSTHSARRLVMSGVIEGGGGGGGNFKGGSSDSQDGKLATGLEMGLPTTTEEAIPVEGVSVEELRLQNVQLKRIVATLEQQVAQLGTSLTTSEQQVARLTALLEAPWQSEPGASKLADPAASTGAEGEISTSATSPGVGTDAASDANTAPEAWGGWPMVRTLMGPGAAPTPDGDVDIVAAAEQAVMEEVSSLLSEMVDTVVELHYSSNALLGLPAATKPPSPVGAGVAAVTDKVAVAAAAEVTPIAIVETADDVIKSESDGHGGDAYADYFKFEALLDSISSHAILPLRGTFIQMLVLANKPLPRRQELPPSAFWSADELQKMKDRLCQRFGEVNGSKRFGSLFVALSYKWLREEHPDSNDNFHLRAVASFLELHLHCDVLSAVFEPLKMADELDCAIFWDYASLYQPPRTPEQESLFLKGRQQVGVWYGHSLTQTWIQSALPPGYEATLSPYANSGWGFVEATLSSAIKPRDKTLDISRHDESKHSTTQLLHSAKLLQRVLKQCRAQVHPLLPPEHAMQLLTDEKTFAVPTDAEEASKIFARFFRAVAPRLPSIELADVGLGPEDVLRLSEALPRFERCKSVDLSGNQIGSESAKALALAVRLCDSLDKVKVDRFTLAVRQLMGKAPLRSLDLSDKGLGMASGMIIAELIRENTCLTSLSVGSNTITGDGAKELAASVLAKPHLEQFSRIPLKDLRSDRLSKLDLFKRGLGVPEAHVLAGMLVSSECSSLTTLNLESNCIGPEGGVAVADALKQNLTLKTLKLCDNRLCGWWMERFKKYGTFTPVAANAIAEALRVNPSLTSLDLRNNGYLNLGDLGKGEAKAKYELMRNAIKHREGFQLLL